MEGQTISNLHPLVHSVIKRVDCNYYYQLVTLKRREHLSAVMSN